MMKRLCFFLVVLVGCSHPQTQRLTGYPMVIDNVYSNPSYDHSCILNVLVLPMDNPLESSEVALHYENLLMALIRNLGKFNYFNVHTDPYFDERSGPIVNLDTGYVDRVKLGEVGRYYNSQAVLKLSITDFQAYPPMRMKVKALLLDADTGERIWAFDHTFDMDDASVVNGLRSWYNERMAGADEKSRFEVSSIRPSVFSNFIFYTLARSYERARVKNMRAIAELKSQERPSGREAFEPYDNENRPFADMNNSRPHTLEEDEGDE